MLLSATKSRKKQQVELVENALSAEEEKRKRDRENFHVTSAAVLGRASQEPSLFGHGTSDDHEATESEFGQGLF